MKLSATSLTGQLNRSLLQLVCGCWLLGSVGVAWYVDHEFTEHLDSALVHSANRLLELAAHEMAEASAHVANPVNAPAPGAPPTTPPRAEDEALPDVPGAEFLLYQVVDGQHRVQMRSQGAPAQAFAVTLRTGFEQTPVWQVYTLRHPVQDMYIHVADALADRRHARDQTLLFLLLPLLLVLPALAYGVQRIVARRMDVVDRFAAQVQQRSGSDLRAVTEEGLPEELLVLAGNVNRLLERLEESLNTERALSANAAHELRTPLTVTQLRLANALRLDMSEAARQELESARQSLGALQRRAEKLLQLSRAESGASSTHMPVRLNLLVKAVTQEFEGQADALGRIQVDLAGDEVVLGDFDAMAIALRNLIENSLRYSAQSPVHVGTRAPGTVYVRDQGPGVDADQLKTMLTRHVRFALNEAGFGLGLSIVKSIVERQHGRLELHSPPVGTSRGFEACMVFATERIRLRDFMD